MEPLAEPCQRPPQFVATTTLLSNRRSPRPAGLRPGDRSCARRTCWPCSSKSPVGVTGQFEPHSPSSNAIRPGLLATVFPAQLQLRDPSSLNSQQRVYCTCFDCRSSHVQLVLFFIHLCFNKCRVDQKCIYLLKLLNVVFKYLQGFNGRRVVFLYFP